MVPETYWPINRRELQSGRVASGRLGQSMEPSWTISEPLKGLENWRCSLLFILLCVDIAYVPPEDIASGTILWCSIGLQNWENLSCFPYRLYCMWEDSPEE